MQPFICQARGLSHLRSWTGFPMQVMIQALPQNLMDVTMKLSNKKHLITTMHYIWNNYEKLKIHAQPNIIMYQFHNQK